MAILLHVAFLYALQAGLGRDIVQQAPQKIVFAELMMPPQTIPELALSTPQPNLPLPVKPSEPLSTVKKAKLASPARRLNLPRPIARPRMATPPPANSTPSQQQVIALPKTTADPVSRPESIASAPVTPQAPLLAPRFDAAYLNNPKPVYPVLARRLGEEGRVVLRVHVTIEGRAGDIGLHMGSGSSRLDEAAIKAVWTWRFIPAYRDNQAVESWVLVPISFKLD